jgi:hypothetical protein
LLARDHSNPCTKAARPLNPKAQNHKTLTARSALRPCRYDLLNLLYQASGQWEKAIEIAEKKDRIHLRCVRACVCVRARARVCVRACVCRVPASGRHRSRCAAVSEPALIDHSAAVGA